jgi:multidrug efflux system outer membrane protein
MIAEKTASNFQDNLDVMQARFNGGFISEVDLYQSKIQLSEAKTAVEVFLRSRGHIENGINILLGNSPQIVPRGLALYDQINLPEVPVGLPSELLDRRPDLLLAERNLHAQTLRIGVAEALKYPSLTLSANLGAEIINPSYLFAGFGAQILGPLFNSKKIRKNIEIEELKTRQLIFSYEYTFINALKEVEDAMIASNTYKREYELRNSQMEMATSASHLSWVRYEGGLTSYLEVLNLQSSQFSAELKASEAFKQELISIIQLYEALGGGWNPENE